jgi:hypothetical protein
MKGTIMPEVFQSERFFREAWPQTSHGLPETERRFDVH